MSRKYKEPSPDSKYWEKLSNMNSYTFGKYLRKVSNGNDWTWKSMKNCNLFFSPNGKLIACVYYSGPQLSTTRTYILKEK